MKEEYVSFELAKKLKEKGFDCKTRELYERNILSCRYEDYPKATIAQVLKWLRKEYGIHIEITAAAFGYSYIISKTPEFGGLDIKHSKYDGPNDGGAWNEWEDCATAAIEYVIDNLI